MIILQAMADKDVVNYVNEQFDKELSSIKLQMESQIEKEVNNKRYVGSEKAQEEARNEERNRIRKLYEPSLEKKAKLLESEMYQDLGGSRTEADKIYLN